MKKSKSIDFKPLGLNDAVLIQQSWGMRSENFTYLSSVVLNSTALAQSYIEQALENPASRAYHVVYDGQICGLVKAIVNGNHALIGYVLDKSYWGRGIASAAVHFVTAEQIQDKTIQRIWATCAIENIGSQRVLEKCGYIREGILKNWIIYPCQGSQAHDNFVYSYPL